MLVVPGCAMRFSRVQFILNMDINEELGWSLKNNLLIFNFLLLGLPDQIQLAPLHKERRAQSLFGNGEELLFLLCQGLKESVVVCGHRTWFGRSIYLIHSC
jgi:hypothetical protein